jgi:hypothetical protein
MMTVARAMRRFMSELSASSRTMLQLAREVQDVTIANELMYVREEHSCRRDLFGLSENNVLSYEGEFAIEAIVRILQSVFSCHSDSRQTLTIVQRYRSPHSVGHSSVYTQRSGAICQRVLREKVSADYQGCEFEFE